MQTGQPQTHHADSEVNSRGMVEEESEKQHGEHRQIGRGADKIRL